MDKLNLNIVSLDVPYPPDYGGVIDIFYKIRALHKLGVNIFLHCFDYGRGEQAELSKYCKVVFYYKRKTGLSAQLSALPYIINTRKDEILLENLKSNSYPILFEGLHTCYYLLKGHFRDRTVILRSHNLEHDYYKALGKREGNIIKKLYYQIESMKLKSVLKKLKSDQVIGAISIPDKDYLSEQFKNTFWLPPFHSNDTISSLEGKGAYALYHGNLSVSENIEAAEELIREFNGKDIELVIAGNNPAPALKRRISASQNIKLADKLSVEEMNILIKNAHVILLPTKQSTGIKLKLIESLCKGRFCIANKTMVDQTSLEECIIPAEQDFYLKTQEFMEKRFTSSQIEKRQEIINQNFDNFRNARLLMAKL